MRQAGRVAVLVLAALAAPAVARADSLITPFIGFTFAGETAFLTLDPDLTSESIPRNVVFGGNWMWLTDRILGFEGEVAFAPGFFEARNVPNLITGSHVMTLIGSVVVAMPVSVTREGLRPYLVGGIGLLRATLDDQVGLLVSSDNSPGLQLGGGAIGFLTDRTGLRFDLRYVRSLDRTADEITLDRRSKLSFWRASVGVVIRY